MNSIHASLGTNAIVFPRSATARAKLSICWQAEDPQLVTHYSLERDCCAIPFGHSSKLPLVDTGDLRQQHRQSFGSRWVREQRISENGEGELPQHCGLHSGEQFACLDT